MVRFIQTSDWQIGMKGGGLGKAGQIVRETRVKSIDNIFKVAQDKKADFVLLCGDIFEHNMIGQEDVKKVISIFNKYPNIQIYLLPGNHDILGADCVYNRPIFQQLKNLLILNSCEPIEIFNAVLHPCPILSKFTKQNITEAIPIVKKDKNIHIGVAHGSLVGKFATSNLEGVNLPVDPSCVDKTGIDYLALGHWHSFRIFKDTKGVDRIAYSGTHEQTNYNEDNAGYCLLIEIKGKGKKSRSNPLRRAN